jgi:nicotinamide mononucleotide transporter
MSIGGWINWRKNTKQNSSLRISVLQKNRLVSLSISGLLLTILLAEFATRFSDASLPYLDAFTTIFAILGTVLVIQRKLENWIIWVFVDLVATGMYLYKGLYLTSILFFTYTIIAISGYFSWKKKLTND